MRRGCAGRPGSACIVVIHRGLFQHRPGQCVVVDLVATFGAHTNPAGLAVTATLDLTISHC